MKPLLALILLAVVAAGCGAAKVHVVQGGSVTMIHYVNKGPILVTGRTATIQDVETGARVTCKDGLGAAVPPRGQGVDANRGQGTVNKSGAAGKSSTAELRLRHLRDGSIVVSCASSR